jgi:hypothetical protein
MQERSGQGFMMRNFQYLTRRVGVCWRDFEELGVEGEKRNGQLAKRIREGIFSGEIPAKF